MDGWARVERYLINSSDPIVNKLGIDFRPDLFYTWNNEQYKIFHDYDYHTDGVELMSKFGDGKLTSQFYSFFIFELLRDYWITRVSYKDGNMATLRKLTRPSGGFEDVEMGLGSGILDNDEMKSIHQSHKYKLEDFVQFNAHKFDIFQKERVEIIDSNPSSTSSSTMAAKATPSSTHGYLATMNKNPIKEITNTGQQSSIIVVPKQLKNKTIEQLLIHNNNIKLLYAKKSELSQIVKDLTRTLSMKTVDSPKTIYLRIRTFNHHIVDNLTKMENKYKI